MHTASPHTEIQTSPARSRRPAIAIRVFHSALALLWFAWPTAAFADEPRPIWVGVSPILSVHHNRLDEVNSSLLSASYSSISTNQPLAGIGFDGGYRRLRLTVDAGLAGARSYHRTAGDRASFSVHQASISLDIGYDVIQHRGMSVFPMIGAAGGDIRLDIDPSDPPLLRDPILAEFGDTEIRRNTWSARALIGVEQRLVLWDRTDDQLLLVFGFRVGYVQQAAQSNWMFRDPRNGEFTTGPSVDTSGPLFRVGIGLAGSAK